MKLIFVFFSLCTLTTPITTTRSRPIKQSLFNRFGSWRGNSHQCGRRYVCNSESLYYHERTCDANPDAALVGRGVVQQHYRDRDEKMNLTQITHSDNFRVYRKNIKY